MLLPFFIWLRKETFYSLFLSGLSFTAIKRMLEGEGIKAPGVSIFSSKIICGECGGYFGSKVWHSTDKYRRVIWRCNHKYGKGRKCGTPHLSEDEIKSLFLEAVNRLLTDKDEVIANMEMLKTGVSDTDGLKDEMVGVTAEMEVLTQQTEDLIAENARRAQDQTEYAKKYDALASRYEEKKHRLAEIQEKIADAEATGEVIHNFIQTLRDIGDVVTEFDESLWAGLVENVTVYGKERVTFLFKGGTEIKIHLCKGKL